jgi:hypothetical protein
MRQLIDYATKMPLEDDYRKGHKFPFNACEIICSENGFILEKLLEPTHVENEEDSDSSDNSEDSENSEVSQESKECVSEGISELNSLGDKKVSEKETSCNDDQVRKERILGSQNIKETKDPEIVYKSVFSLLNNKLGLLSSSDKVKKLYDFYKLEEDVKNDRNSSWTIIKKKKNTRDFIIENYIIDKKRKYNLKNSDANYLFSIINV